MNRLQMDRATIQTHAPSDQQPDQRPEFWNDHVLVYEQVFEPFSLALARPMLSSLLPDVTSTTRAKVLDVAAGSGGVALELAAKGCDVTAIDASQDMVSRIRARAMANGAAVVAEVMDGQRLAFADATFDAAISVFGVVLFPDAVRGLAEMARVTRRGGKVGVLTWTEPQNYGLASALRRATLEVWPDQPTTALPAQLRYREAADFAALFSAAGLDHVRIERVEAQMKAPSARWLAERLGFAPGMAATLANLGNRRKAVLEAFVHSLEREQGVGAVSLDGVAFQGTAQVP